MIGLTEDQLWSMTPRTFHNLLKGRIQKEQAQTRQRQIMHQELVLATLSPHMKKIDRDKAYNNLYNSISSEKPKEEKKMTPEEVKAFLEKHKK